MKNQSSKTSRVKSGIKNLDKLIQGGFKDHSINLIVGDPGAGKTIFALQFLMEGLKNNESCLYITFEEKKEKLYGDISTFGWDFEKFEKDNKFFYMEYTPAQVRAMIEEGGGTIDQLISSSNITRIVIDSVTSFSLLYHDELSRKEAALALFQLINKWGCTAILTSQADSDSEEIVTSSLDFEADSIILLYHSKIKGIRLRALEILKMRGTSHTNKTMKLSFEKNGLTIEPSEIVTLIK